MENVPFSISNQNESALDGRIGTVVTYSTDVNLTDSDYGHYIVCETGAAEVAGSVKEGFQCTIHNNSPSAITLPTGSSLEADASTTLQYAEGWRELRGLSGENANLQVVNHGTDATVSRPKFDTVMWVGSVEPANALANDIWIDSSL